MIPAWLLVVVAVYLFCVYLVMLEWPSIRALFMIYKIPGVRWIFPIIGAIHYFIILTGPEILYYIEKVAKEYPRLLSFYACGIPAVLLQEPEDIQVILSSPQHIQKGREYLPILAWLNEGLLTSTGEKWHFRRKLLTPTFHFRILEDAFGSMNKGTDVLVKKLLESKGESIDVDKQVTKCALDIIGETAMGVDLKAQSEAGKAYVTSIKKAGECAILRILRIWEFKEWVFVNSSNGKSFYKHLKILHDFTDKVIRERKASYDPKKFEVEDDTGRKCRKAFLDSLLDLQMKQPGLLTDLDIREEVDTFMFEGHDTTSAAITFGLWLLGHHAEEQEKVFEELRDIMEDEDAEVTSADTHRMVYLEKVIKETLRLYPSVPYISRQLNQDCLLDDEVVVPATANVVIMPYLVHRNPRFFPEPEKFDPERFSEENTVGRHPFAYIPFSAGPRNCIGQKFAMLELKVTLAKILRKLHVKSVTRRDEFKVQPYLIGRPSVPLKCIFTPRKL